LAASGISTRKALEKMEEALIIERDPATAIAIDKDRFFCQ